MPVLISNVEMNDLAKKLAKMRFNRAKGYIRRLDREIRLDIYRSSVGTEWITRFALPNKGLWITLVEIKEMYGDKDTWGNQRTRFKYVEARVEPIPDEVHADKQLSNRGLKNAGVNEAGTQPNL